MSDSPAPAPIQDSPGLRETVSGMQPQRSTPIFSSAESQQGLATSWLDALWQALIDPRGLVAVGALLTAFALLGVLLPQMPGQLRSEALAGERWLTATAESYGALGGLLRGVGGFDVLRSPVFWALLWAALFLSLMQVAHLASTTYRFHRLPRALDDVEQPCGEAASIFLAERIFRWRGTAPFSATTAIERCEAQMQPWAGRIERRTVSVPLSAFQMEAFAAIGVEPPQTVQEERVLGLRQEWASALRPLLPAGVALALMLVGWYSVAGSSFVAPALLPGERASDATLGLTVEYQLLSFQPNVIGPVLQVSKGEAHRFLPLVSGSAELNGVVVNVRPGPPALLVRTLDDAPLLMRLGQSFGVSEVGLGFPHPGGEQALVVPRYGVGMRIIRQDEGGTAPDSAFIVEVFQGENETPTQRFTVVESQVIAIEATEGQLLLNFVPIAMFQVYAYTAPQLWLLLPALLLMAAGVCGFLRKAIFVLVQAGPWPMDRSIVVLQSNRLALLTSLREQLEGGAGEGESGRAGE
jgi:hypothetical protein